MRKLPKKGFNHSHAITSIYSPWKKGDYKGNKNFAKYKQHKRSLNEDIVVNTGFLMDEYLAAGGNITICPDKIA